MLLLSNVTTTGPDWLVELVGPRTELVIEAVQKIQKLAGAIEP